VSILVNTDTRVLVQGITGNEGVYHTKQMIQYGTKVVAGVTPGKGGEWVQDGKIPVFDSVKNAVDATEANTSVVFVPARYSADAILEAAENGLPLVVCITEGIPVHDMIQVHGYLKSRNIRMIGPNSPGLLTPNEAKVGIIPGDITMPGRVGVVSRSGTLTYEVLFALKKIGEGVSTCVGIGGDMILGMGFEDILSLFEADAHTDVIVLIGEIGGMEEEKAAEYIERSMTKPVVAYVAGKMAPPGRRMGHAGALIEMGSGGADDKIKALKSAGVKVALHPEDVAELIGKIG
jgi:succinyl-CoA synthetase alpha subunit